MEKERKDKIFEGEQKSELEIKTQRPFHGIVVRELAADVIPLDGSNYAFFAQFGLVFIVESEFQDNTQALFHMVSAGDGKADAAAGDIADMGDAATSLARSDDGVGARQTGQLAVMTAEVETEGEYFAAAATDLDGVFFVPVRFGGDVLGRIAGRADNRGGIIVADKGLDVGHNDQS